MDVEIEGAVRDAVGEAARVSPDFDSERLEELGWGELLEADAESAVRSFLDEQGRLVLSSSVLDSVILAALDDDRFAWPAAGVVYPFPEAQNAEPARVPCEASRSAGLRRISSYRLRQRRAPGSSPLAAMTSRSSPSMASTRRSGSSRCLRMPGVLEDAAVGADESAAAIAAGRRALAHELVGLSSRMVDIVVGHALRAAAVQQAPGREPGGAAQAR